MAEEKTLDELREDLDELKKHPVRERLTAAAIGVAAPALTALLLGITPAIVVAILCVAGAIASVGITHAKRVTFIARKNREIEAKIEQERQGTEQGLGNAITVEGKNIISQEQAVVLKDGVAVQGTITGAEVIKSTDVPSPPITRR